MSYPKITSADTAGKGVVGLPDTPGLTAYELQTKFEEIVNDVIIPKFNELSNMLDAVITDGSTVELSPELLSTALVKAGDSLDVLANKLNTAYSEKIISALQGVLLDGVDLVPYQSGKVNIPLSERIGEISSGVTGVRGSAENTYRTGAVTITKENLGLGEASVRGVASNTADTETKLIPLNVFNTQINSVFSTMAHNSAKNFVKYPYNETTKIVNGITFTDLGNGKIRANGTATEDCTFTLGSFSLTPHAYWIAGCPQVGAGKCAVTVNGQEKISGSVAGTVLTYSNETTVTLAIKVYAGATLNDAVFEPYIILMQDNLREWRPYAMTNYELTKKAQSAETQLGENTADIGALEVEVGGNTTAIGNLNTAIGSLKFVALTQAQYNALATKDANTLYFIKGA